MNKNSSRAKKNVKKIPLVTPEDPQMLGGRPPPAPTMAFRHARRPYARGRYSTDRPGKKLSQSQSVPSDMNPR